MLAHCLIDNIYLHVFKNIDILIILLLFFLSNSFFEDHIRNKCTFVCFNQ